MNAAIGRLGDVDLSVLSSRGPTQALASAPGASHRSARSGRSRFRPTCHMLQRMQREFMARQNFASCLSQSNRTHREEKYRRVENKPNDENDTAGHQTQRGPLQKL